MRVYQVLNWMVDVFALRRWQDYFVKPILTMATYLVTFTLVSLATFSPSLDDLKPIVLAVFLTQAPYLALAFALVHFLSMLRGQLADMALTDVLTGLPNRRAFMQKADDLQEMGTIGHVLIVDADHFKKVNDTYGHAVGDICLQAISRRLGSLRQPQDVIGRIGGEEFGIYLPFATQAEVRKYGQRLCQTIRVDLPNAEVPLHLTVSIGAAETRPKEGINHALARADHALYDVKANGRGHMRIWQQSLQHKVA